MEPTIHTYIANELIIAEPNWRGTADDNDSTRSEIGGIYAIVAAVEQVVEEHNITEEQVTRKTATLSSTAPCTCWDTTPSTFT